MLRNVVLIVTAAALGCGSTDPALAPEPRSGPAADPVGEATVEPAASPGVEPGNPGPVDTTPPALRGHHPLYSEQTFFIWFTEDIPDDGVVALRAWVDGEPIPVSVDEEARAHHSLWASDSSTVPIRLDGPTDGGFSGRILPLTVELDVKDRTGNSATASFEAQWITDTPALRGGAHHLALTADGSPTVAEIENSVSTYDDLLGISRSTPAGWSAVEGRVSLQSSCLALAIDPAGPAYVGVIDDAPSAAFHSGDSNDARAFPPIPPAEGRSGPYCVDAVVDGSGRLVAVVEDSTFERTTYLRLLAYEGAWRELTEVAVPGDCPTMPSLHVDARRTPVLSYFERDCPPGNIFWESRPAPALVALRLLALEGESLTPAAEPLSSRTFVKLAAGAPSPVVLTAGGVLRWTGASWEDLGVPAVSAHPWPGIDWHQVQIAITPGGEVVLALPTSDGAELWRWRGGWVRVPGFDGLPAPQIAGLEIDAERRPMLLFNVAGAAFVRRGDPLP